MTNRMRVGGAIRLFAMTILCAAFLLLPAVLASTVARAEEALESVESVDEADGEECLELAEPESVADGDEALTAIEDEGLLGGASMYNFTISYSIDYDQSYAILSQVNSDRSSKGLSALKWDEKLQSYAMQRAVELSVYFAYARPDGSWYGDSSYILANVGGSGANGYADAVGRRSNVSQAAAMEGLRGNQTYRDYIYGEDSTGASRIKCLGAAVVKVGDYWFSYMCFHDGTTTTTGHKTGTSSSKRTISILAEYIQSSSSGFSVVPSSITVPAGGSSNVTVLLGKAPIGAHYLSWSSSNTSVATAKSSTVSEPLAVNGIAKGSTTITGRLYDVASCQLTVNVTAPLTSSVSSINVAVGSYSNFKLYRGSQLLSPSDVNVTRYGQGGTAGFEVYYSSDNQDWEIGGTQAGSFSVGFEDKTTGSTLMLPITVTAQASTPRLTCSKSSITLQEGASTTYYIYRDGDPVGSSSVSCSFDSNGIFTQSTLFGTPVWTVDGYKAGSYSITFTDKTYGTKLVLPVTVTAKPFVGKAITWTRLAGAGRYDTMKAIVDSGWEPFEEWDNSGWYPSDEGIYERAYADTALIVIIATGRDFRDALAASGLAGVVHGPVVLVDGKADHLNAQARSVLERLDPLGAFIVGGTASVSDGVAREVKALLHDPSNPLVFQRVSGSNSCATSAAIARVAKKRTSYTGANAWQGSVYYLSTHCWADNTAIICRNDNFKDALSVAPVSYVKHWPILLAGNGKSLNNDVLQALDELGIKKVYIAGGTGSVDPYVETQLSWLGITVQDRFAGSDAVHTSRLIAEWGLQNGLSADGMGYASSQNYPDALAGAALCGKKGSVLLLCDDKYPGKTDYNVSFAETHRREIEQGYLFGGTSSFSNALQNRLPRTQ